MSSNAQPTSETDESNGWPPRQGDRFYDEEADHVYVVHGEPHEGHGCGQYLHLSFETSNGRHDIYPLLSRVIERVVVAETWEFVPRAFERGE